VEPFVHGFHLGREHTMTNTLTIFSTSTIFDSNDLLSSHVVLLELGKGGKVRGYSSKYLLKSAFSGESCNVGKNL
jgi:hypothetical protein